MPSTGCFSKIVTRFPARSANQAEVNPAIPEPITAILFGTANLSDLTSIAISDVGENCHVTYFNESTETECLRAPSKARSKVLSKTRPKDCSAAAHASHDRKPDRRRKFHVHKR
jgi:hypothetical protein